MTRPMLLAALVTISLCATVTSAATITAFSDSRGGTITASDGIGSPVNGGFTSTPGQINGLINFNQCVDDSGRKACLASISQWLDLGPGNTTSGFTIASTMSATTPNGNGFAISNQFIAVQIIVTGAGLGVPFQFSGGLAESGADGFIKLTGPGVELIYDSNSTWDQIVTLVDGLYSIFIDANATANSGLSANKSVTFTTHLKTAPVVCPSAGSCFGAHLTPGCADSDCCSAVCAADAFCCVTEWDQQCVVQTSVCALQDLAGPIIDPLTGHSYVLISPAMWGAAHEFANGIGGELVTINNSYENQFVRCNLFDNVPGVSSSRGWLGLNDVDAEGTFVWLSGERSTFAPWSPGEPNDLDSEDAVEMLDTGLWNDAGTYVTRFGAVEMNSPSACAPGAGSCFSTHGAGCDDESCCNVVCGFDGFCCGNSWDQTCVNEANGLCSPDIVVGPIFNPSTHHRYYLLDTCAWSEGEKKARALNGHLVTIDSAAENQWLFLNLATYGNVNRRCFIGFNDQAIEGSFQWTDDSAVGYTNWSPGEPNNSDVGGEQFAEIDGASGGLWNDNDNTGLTGFTTQAVVEVPCIGDVDSNFSVNAADLGLLLGAWNTPSEAFDLNGDGIVSAPDLGILLGAWGSCGSSNCCGAHGGASCDQPGCAACVCAFDPSCCATSWDADCASLSSGPCFSACQCGP